MRTYRTCDSIFELAADMSEAAVLAQKRDQLAQEVRFVAHSIYSLHAGARRGKSCGRPTEAGRGEATTDGCLAY